MLIRTGFGGQLSGSVGGVVASHNKGGAYLRNRTVPTNPNSARQLTARMALASASQAWAVLTQVQRDGWNAYAAATPLVNRLGESITVSGFNMYIRTNSFLASSGESAIDDAPLTPGQSSLGFGGFDRPQRSGWMRFCDVGRDGRRNGHRWYRSARLGRCPVFPRALLVGDASDDDGHGISSRGYPGDLPVRSACRDADPRCSNRVH